MWEAGILTECMAFPAQDGTHERSARAPVWADEDDEKVEVNIAGRDRLRKLRQTEEDASISGSTSCLPTLSVPLSILLSPIKILFAWEDRATHVRILKIEADSLRADNRGDHLIC